MIRELEILGEAAGLVSGDSVAAHPEIPWREITGIRHKLIHDYFVVDLGIVWRTATVNVPEVHPLVRIAAATLSKGNPWGWAGALTSGWTCRPRFFSVES